MRLVRTAAAAALLMAAPPAAAQTVLEGGFDLDLLRPAPGSSSLVVAERPRVPAKRSYSFSFLGSYMADPLVACPQTDPPCGGDMEYGAVISDRLTGWLLGSYSLGFTEIGLALPVTVVNGTDLASPPGEELGSMGLGDLRASAKVPLLGRGKRFGAGVLAAASLPTGKTEDFLGGPGVALEGWVLADFATGPVVVTGSGGFRFRTSDRSLENLDQGSAALVAGGAAVDVWNRRLAVILDLHGSLGTTSGAGAEERAFESVAALRYTPRASWVVTAGAGTGLGSGAGAPAWRAFAGLTWRHERLDRDFDGIVDDEDRCPLVPEDHDSFEDKDGCPDFDNDQDKILDEADACRNEPEDADGFEDEDGCPDADNDKDTIVDKSDGCPDQAEDKDDFEDADGCPDLDNDQDTIADATDECRNEPEDLDSFSDEDGCPDLDNDADGLADKVDQCPNEAEVVNDLDDDDGCPDERLVIVTSRRIELKQTVHFEYKSATIKEESFKLLEEVATALADNPSLSKIRIEGHTDDVGGRRFNQKLSEERAEAVKTHLVEVHGIDAKRLTTKGYGKRRPVKQGDDEETRAVNRRVEFVIVKRKGD